MARLIVVCFVVGRRAMARLYKVDDYLFVETPIYRVSLSVFPSNNPLMTTEAQKSPKVAGI